MPGVKRRQRVRNEIHGEQPARAYYQTVGKTEVADGTQRYLADAESRAVLDVEQLAIFGRLASSEQCPARMPQRGFSGQGVVIMAADRLSAPGEGRGRLPARRHFVRPQRTRRKALLVHPWLKLLGVDEAAPAPLQRERASRVPRQPDRGGIERSGLDIPAVLVRLAAVEAADLDLDAI